MQVKYFVKVCPASHFYVTVSGAASSGCHGDRVYTQNEDIRSFYTEKVTKGDENSNTAKASSRETVGLRKLL